MTTRRWALAAVGVAVAIGAGAASQASEVEQAVLAAQDKRLAATIAADVAALAAMMTDDLTYTHSSAVVETKAEFLDALKTAKYRYKSAAFDERRVRLHGDTGIISGVCRVQVVASGRDLEVKLRFTELYVKQGGAWKMALWQSTRVPEATP